MTGEYVDMFDSAVIDPAEVIKNVVINAASVAGTLLTTEAIIVNTSRRNRLRNATTANCLSIIVQLTARKLDTFITYLTTLKVVMFWS
jgi:hypothetical protein